MHFTEVMWREITANQLTLSFNCLSHQGLKAYFKIKLFYNVSNVYTEIPYRQCETVNTGVRWPFTAISAL